MMSEMINQPTMKKLFLFLFSVLLTGALTAQDDNYMTKAGDTDPKAKALLTKVRQKYDGYQSLQADFTLEINMPEQPQETQSGTLARKGDQYRMTLNSYEVISDGQSVWLIMNNNKEVQINDMPEEGEDDSILSPQSLFSIYERGDFVYAITNEYKDGGRTIQEVEFKPLDDDSDYAKLRLSVDKNKTEVVSVEAFAKDGSRYKLLMRNVQPNKAFPANHFTFDKAQYPDYYVEDLRM